MKKPVEYDEVVAAILIKRLSDGETIQSICLDFEMPSTDIVRAWRRGEYNASSLFDGKYARARLDQADSFATETVGIADNLDEKAQQAAVAAAEKLEKENSGATKAEIRRAKYFAKKRSAESAKLAIDVRKWIAARQHARNWGDAVTHKLMTDPDNPPQINLSNVSTAMLEKIAGLEEQLQKGENGGGDEKKES